MTVTNVLAIECAWDVLDSEEGDQVCPDYVNTAKANIDVYERM